MQRWRLSVGLRWSHERVTKRYREGFASKEDAEARRREMLAVNARSGMDGVCALVWGDKARVGAASARVGALRGGLLALAGEFVAAKEAAGRRDRTTVNLTFRVKQLAKICGDIPPRQVKASRLQLWLDSTPLSPRSRINYAIVWRNFFRWCVRSGHCDRSPMERVELPSAERKLPAVLSAYRLARLVAAAWRDAGSHKDPGPMLAHVLLLFFSGVRPEEILKLEWKQFGWDRGEIVLDEAATKISRVRHSRLDPRLARVLKALAASGEVPGYWSRRMFRRIRARAGCGEGKGWGADIGRHTYASTLYALGTAEHDLSADMGNSVTVLRSHYINRLVSRDEAAKCWRVLDAMVHRLASEPKAKATRQATSRAGTPR